MQGLRNRLIVVPNGMEIEKYQKQLSKQERHSLRMSLGIEDTTGLLVAVTRISKEKKICEIISFLPKLLEKQKDVKFLIVGDGPDRHHLEKIVEKLQLNDKVIFTGRIPAREVWKYYAAGDVFVSASVFEVHSMSYLESLASGLPLLCREDEALLGVLDSGINGYTYNSREEFVDYACKLLNDDECRKGMANASLQKANGFSSDAFAKAMLKVYEEAICSN